MRSFSLLFSLEEIYSPKEMLFQSKEDSRDCSNVEYGDLRRIFLQVSRLIDNDELSFK